MSLFGRVCHHLFLLNIQRCTLKLLLSCDIPNMNLNQHPLRMASTWWSKSYAVEKQSNITVTGLKQTGCFFKTNKGVFTLCIHKDKIRVDLFLNVTIPFKRKILLFSQRGKKIIYLIKRLSRPVLTDIKLGHAFISGKNQLVCSNHNRDTHLFSVMRPLGRSI